MPSQFYEIRITSEICKGRGGDVLTSLRYIMRLVHILGAVNCGVFNIVI